MKERLKFFFDWTSTYPTSLNLDMYRLAASCTALFMLVSLNACFDHGPGPNLPFMGKTRIETEKPIPTSSHSCLMRAKVVHYGVNLIHDYGFVYGPSKDLTNPAMTKISVGKGKPHTSFELEIKQLGNSSSDSIYVTAYLNTAKGIVYGNTVGFKLRVFN